MLPCFSLLTDKRPCSFLKIFKKKTLAIEFQNVILFVYTGGQGHNAKSTVYKWNKNSNLKSKYFKYFVGFRYKYEKSRLIIHYYKLEKIWLHFKEIYQELNSSNKTANYEVAGVSWNIFIVFYWYNCVRKCKIEDKKNNKKASKLESTKPSLCKTNMQR